MKILAYIYLFDILLKITSPRLNGLTNLLDYNTISDAKKQGLFSKIVKLF